MMKVNFLKTLIFEIKKKSTQIDFIEQINNKNLGDIVVFFLIQNIFIFSFIFWLLTWAGEYFYKKKNHAAKRNFYECGFKSTSDINVQINLNFSILCVFLILYDIEFTFLMPIFFNFIYIQLFEYIILNIFILIIIVSLIYDWQMNALSWQY